jgi:NADPH-dependent 2,4-dienoyl-CoA reductase/sulfur reductase-like enzyme
VANLSPSAKPMVVIAVPGQVTRLADAERLLAEGAMDMVGAVRGLIAEPRLVTLAVDGLEATSRPCINVNQCFEMNLGFGCAVNPVAGHEERWGARHGGPAPRAMRVTVVGGGPCGLEAASVAAARGHHVTLFEQRSDVGGGLALWASIPGRERVGDAVGWWRARVAELPIELRLQTPADVAGVLATEPDVVILASGSRYSREGLSGFRPAPIPGFEHAIVCTPEVVLEDGMRSTGRVVILDDEGLQAAVGVAEILAAGGAEVQLVSRGAPGARVHFAEHSFVMARLRAAGVTLLGGTYVAEIAERSVTLVDLLSQAQRVVGDVDAVVLATARQPVDDLAGVLEGRVPYVYLLGDALAPRRLRDATYEGHRFARLIGEDAMPATVMEQVFQPFEDLRPAATAR